MNNLNKILSFILILLIGLFCLSLFKNIQYPLLWNDEADTAMFATRILKYGYPKVHDGKNTPIQAPPTKTISVVDEKTDAFLESDWIQYYFSTPFMLLAKKTGDLYLQTAILRIPFAVVGFIGLLIFSLSVISVFNNNTSKLIFLSLFALIELLSIPLVLHLREMRYYSILIFLFALLLYVYFRYHIFNNLSYKRYFLLLVILSLLILNTFHPAFFPLMVFLFFNAIKPLFTGGKTLIQKLSEVKKIIHPLLVILAFSIPYFLFFKTFSIAFAMSQTFNFNLNYYITQLSKIISFFWRYDLLLSLLGIKLALFSFDAYSMKKTYQPFKQKLAISNYFSVFLLIYSLFIARVPYYLFTRYFIILQPILTIIFILDVYVLFKLLTAKFNKKIVLSFLGFAFVFNLFFLNGVQKYNYFVGHIYELTHQFQGPLDYIIPYIKKNYSNTEKLTIATNYEELTYMFYLDSKVTIGYVGVNLENDMKFQPDIIIYRRSWEKKGWLKYSQIFNYFLSQDKYKTISFPVYDYPVNNIPDLDFDFSHLSQTKMATNENEKLRIFVRESIN